MGPIALEYARKAVTDAEAELAKIKPKSGFANIAVPAGQSDYWWENQNKDNKSYYIFSKSMAIVFHYWILIENWRSSLTLFENVTAVIFFIIHLILYINKDHNL